ncbi:MAG: hypothetical protein QME14_04025 [Methanobacteriaceae archaeon]|nr:hypothetical protein [Methanobacteriaceae archaeon]
MLELSELNVLRAIGDDIKKRDDLTLSYQCCNFKFTPCTALDLESSILKALENFESTRIIKIHEKNHSLDGYNITMTRRGFYEYLKHSGSVLDTFKDIALELEKDNLNSQTISQNISTELVVVSTILEEWAENGLINITKKDSIEIKKITPHGQKFIKALLSV